MVLVWLTLSLEASQTSLGFTIVHGITPLLVEALPWLDVPRVEIHPSSKKKKGGGLNLTKRTILTVSLIFPG